MKWNKIISKLNIEKIIIKKSSINLDGLRVCVCVYMYVCMYVCIYIDIFSILALLMGGLRLQFIQPLNYKNI